MSESELSDFLETIPDGLLDDVVAEIDAAPEPSNGPNLGANYAGERSRRAAEVINAKTAAAQEIGPLPAIANPARRRAASQNNLLFADTYFKPTFYLPWAPYQRSMMERFEAVILSGGRECHAVRRGGLKSTCVRVSAMWAVLNGHRRFPVLVGATDDKASEHRDNFFALMSSSTTLIDDYPEITPLLLKWRQPKRQFRLDGRLLQLHPKDGRGRIVFPDIFDSASCQAHIAPYSVNATDVAGLSYVDRFGVTIRPDLLIFDDVQTPQSSRSPLMTEEREDSITKTFCGLAGLGEKIAAIMVATVREHDDLTERFLSRARHPDWDGARYPSVIRFPDRSDLWDAYGQKLAQGKDPDEGKRLAQEYYVIHRADMDVGGVVAWEHDKQPGELSALQSLMTVRALDPAFFKCEIQQQGEVAVNTSGIKLDAQTLQTRLSTIPRGIVPDQTAYLTAFVDSSDQVLWWMVCAFQQDFSGAVVDYGTYPDQRRPVFYKSDLTTKISDLMPDASWEEAFVAAHNRLELELLVEWENQSGQTRQIDLMLKDWADGGQKPRIESQVMASRNRNRIRTSRGRAPKPGRKPVHMWGNDPRDRETGMHWVEHRAELPVNVQYDVTFWKSHAARRLLTTIGAPSAITLPGTDERANRLLCEHFTAETPKSISYDGQAGIVWEAIPGRNNDWWDCFVGCCMAASMLGCGIVGETKPKKVLRQVVLPDRVKR